MNPAIIQTQNSITIVFHEPEVLQFNVNRGNPNFLEIRSAIKEKDWEQVKQLCDLQSSVKNFVDGKCQVKDGVLSYNGEELHSTLAERILDFMKEGLDVNPLIRFLENMMKNPSFRSRKELYDFLENENLPITDDGHFLAYKAVNIDYSDMWSGTIDNSIGNLVIMDRSRVDDDSDHGCSSGLHAGSLDYVDSYGGSRSHHKIIVKINPEHVVSVPREDHRKLRCSEYEVVKQFDTVLEKPCYFTQDNEFREVEVKSARQKAAEFSDDSDFDSDYDWDSIYENLD